MTHPELTADQTQELEATEDLELADFWYLMDACSWWSWESSHCENGF